VFVGAAVLVARDRRRLARDAWWTAPLLAAALAAASAGRRLGPWGDVGGVVVIGVGAYAVACWGSPPWRSRLLGRRARSGGPRVAVALLATAATGALLAALGAATVEGAPARHVLVFVAVSSSECAVAMAAVGARQWRFAPRARLHALATTWLLASMVLLGYPALAWSGAWWPVTIVVVGVVAACWTARMPCRTTRALAHASSGAQP
jgi:hypothetical protein